MGTIPPPAKKPCNWLDITKSGLEILGLVTLIVYTVFSGLQWAQMRRTNRLTKEALNASDTSLQQTLGKMQEQVDAANKAVDVSKKALNQDHDQFNMSQRPYLAQTSMRADAPQFYVNPAKSDGSGQLYWNLYITNYGKTPAINIASHQEMSLEGKPYFLSYGGSGKPAGKGIDVGGFQPPGAESFDTVLSAPMQRQEFDRIMAANQSVSIRVRIQYQDMNGSPYETSICLRRMNVGAITICKKDNYIK
jgi:hypothetical protein